MPMWMPFFLAGVGVTLIVELVVLLAIAVRRLRKRHPAQNSVENINETAYAVLHGRGGQRRVIPKTH